MEKIAYVVKKKKEGLVSRIPCVGLIYSGVAENVTIDEAANTLVKLENRGYTIKYKDFIIEEIVPFSFNLRLLDEKEIEELNKEIHVEKLRQKYYFLSEEERESLEGLLGKGVIEMAILWAEDPLLRPIAERGRDSEFRVKYYLAGTDNPCLLTSIDLLNYSTGLSYFREVFDFKNGTEEEAKRFSGIGRPLNQKDLEFLVERKIEIQ